MTEPAALPEAIMRARSEAQSAFGDGKLILERAIDGARHVEIQIFADSHGNVVHLGERDCSVQRRFQKVIEEAPSPAVDAELRARMGAVAVLAAHRSGYRGAGTVEFLLAPDGSFYFLEMNTRLQVEHPVTELITGVDLVQWQLLVAEGEALPLTQAQVQLRGHALEARLYAEDPSRAFLPQTGTIAALTLPAAPGVRVDHWLAVGLPIGTHYDPLLAKVIAHGANREEARRRLVAALSALRVLGLHTNQTFLGAVLDHPDFIGGRAATDFLDRHFAIEPARPAALATLAAAALCFLARERGAAGYPPETSDFTNSVGLAWPFTLEVGTQRYELQMTSGATRGSCHVSAGTTHADIAQSSVSGATLTLRVDSQLLRFDYAWVGDTLWLHTPDGPLALRDSTYAPSSAAEGQGSGRAVAPMDGAVIDAPVAVGDAVTRGQTLAVVEAMKLELRVTADSDGVVHAVHVQRGQQVKARQLLVEVRPTAQPEAGRARAQT